MNKLIVLGVFFACGTAHALGISGQGTWETTLQARDFNGDSVVDAYYDTSLNITWTANANINGLASWEDQLAWAENFSLGDATDWRLTRVIDTGTAGCNFSYSNTDCGYNVDPNTGELAHLFYVTLANMGGFDTFGNVLIGQAPLVAGTMNTASFSGLIYSELGNGEFYTNTIHSSTPGDAWAFGFAGGAQDHIGMTGLHAAWAVHDGDVFAASVVPIPAAVWLFASGLGLLGWMRRRIDGGHA